MPDDTKKTDDLAIDPIDGFSIRGGWLHLDNHDRIKLAYPRLFFATPSSADLRRAEAQRRRGWAAAGLGARSSRYYAKSPSIGGAFWCLFGTDGSGGLGGWTLFSRSVTVLATLCQPHRKHKKKKPSWLDARRAIGRR